MQKKGGGARAYRVVETLRRRKHPSLVICFIIAPFGYARFFPFRGREQEEEQGCAELDHLFATIRFSR